MTSDTKQFYQNSLDIKSILKESENIIPNSSKSSITDISKNPKNSLLSIFQQQISRICIFPLGSKENYPGNYDKYIQTTLTQIAQLQEHINFEYALDDPNIFEGVPKVTSQKKILLLDLDETLIHADFDEEFADNKSIKYDKIIKFSSKNEKNTNFREFFENEDKIEEEKIEEDEEIVHSVGIFVRNGVNEFLNEVSKHFDVGIFTASVKEYADAVISFLDPENKLIKFRLYRNNCINFNDAFSVKDLRIFKGVDLKNIILIDNSMYSFSAQLKNGVLINSFYYDKNDTELYNVLGYLINFILPADDIREVNEQFFNFQQITNTLLNINNYQMESN
jgi:Dullard-like phosphatase family protein